MTYADALAHLHSLRQFGFKPGLGVSRLLAGLAGNPHERLRFIHVAGTNGKGSVCAMLESVYRRAGYRTALYTSPHLVRFGERIQVNRVSIPDADLSRLTGCLKERAATAEPPLEPTFFEFTTILALCWFAEQNVDLVIWETGLGGRWDATNIVQPLAAVVTNIGWDHMNVLGNTLAEIAAEKAGIFKREVPALTATRDPDALAILEWRARELDAPFITVGKPALAQFKFVVPLPGEHQRWNAALAAAVVRTLRPVLPVSDEQLQRGLETVHWPGRFQVLRHGGKTLLLDGAHNREGVTALREALTGSFAGQRPVLVLGALADKEWKSMVRELAPLAARIITVAVSSKRTVPAEDLRQACLSAAPATTVDAANSVTEALQAAAGDPFLLVTGSLYLIGEVLEQLGKGGDDASERSLNEWGGAIPAPGT